MIQLNVSWSKLWREGDDCERKMNRQKEKRVEKDTSTLAAHPVCPTETQDSDKHSHQPAACLVRTINKVYACCTSCGVDTDTTHPDRWSITNHSYTAATPTVWVILKFPLLNMQLIHLEIHQLVQCQWNRSYQPSQRVTSVLRRLQSSHKLKSMSR